MKPVRFYLGKIYKEGYPVLIEAKFSYQTDKLNRFRYNTGESILPKYWNKQTQRPKNIRGNSELVRITEHLNEINAKIHEIYLEYVRAHKLAELTPKEFKRRMQIWKLGVEIPTKVVPFFDYIDQFLQQYKESSRYSLGSYKTYKSAASKLKEYQKETDIQLNFSMWNKSAFQRFADFLFEKDLTDNTAHKIIFTGLKNFLTNALLDEQHQNDLFIHIKAKDLGIIKTDGFKISLNREELIRLHKLNIIDARKSAIRDFFVVACLSGGQRFADWKKLNKDHIICIEGRNYFEYSDQKTGFKKIKKIVVPISPLVQAILDKHNGYLPSEFIQYSQKVNITLKELGKRIGSTDMVKKHIRKKGKLQYYNLPKYELLTTHVARNTFRTLLAQSGVDTKNSKMLMGHSSDKVHEIYNRLSDEETARKAADLDIFNIKE